MLRTWGIDLRLDPPGYLTGSELPEQNAPVTALLPGPELTGLLAPEGVDGLAPLPETVATTKGDIGQELVPERAVIQHQLPTPGEGSLVEIASKPGPCALLHVCLSLHVVRLWCMLEPCWVLVSGSDLLCFSPQVAVC